MRYEGRNFKKFAQTGRAEAWQESSSLSEIFHENTKLTPLQARRTRIQLARFQQSPVMQRLGHAPRKIYSFNDSVELPELRPENALEQAIAGRRTNRLFSGQALTCRELAKLMHYAYGVTHPGSGYRAVASGGALYPLELYAVALKVEGLEPGVYHYAPGVHRLDVVERGDMLPRLCQCIWMDDVDTAGAAAAIIITSCFVRCTIKYHDRGYRMILMEAGEVAQNLALVATSMGIASCLLGGFQDDELSALVGADGHEEAALLPMILGRKREEPQGETLKQQATTIGG